MFPLLYLDTAAKRDNNIMKYSLLSETIMSWNTYMFYIHVDDNVFRMSFKIVI